ncbi:MAG TPA: TolC family protein [Vicinamibacterales bacterium]|nr:TolC family protein [Vicinamibacterales bacterium]
MAVVSGTPVFVSAQAPPAETPAFIAQPVGGLGSRPTLLQAAQQAAAAQPPAIDTQVRRLTADEAVKLALENNLGIQAARLDPRIEDLNVLAVQTGWSPSFSSTFQNNSIQQPSSNVLTGTSESKQKRDVFTSNFGLTQTLKWGGTYDFGFDNSRVDSNNSGNTWRPQLNSSLNLNYSQPLMRGWAIDNLRQQLQVATKNREIADVGLRQSIASTTRAVRNAYWNLAYTVASLGVQQQSLELAEESLRNTRARVEIGTIPPIDIVEAESEVAARQEAVIVAEANIATAEDNLRALVFDTAAPDFWNIKIEPTELPPFKPITVDVDGAVRNALDRRTDLQQTKKSMEATDVNIRFFRNQTLPDVTANINYGLAALGGTRLPSGNNPLAELLGLPPQQDVGPITKGYPSVLGDLLGLDTPSWTASLSISYPIGRSQADANLARTRLQQSQAQTQLRNQQLQVTTQVRQQARNLQTNQQRVQSTRASRQLAERRLDAEQRKFTAGTSTSFQVFQAQRDLSLARNNELRAILDYNQSAVDFETVQEVPIGGGGGGVTVTTVSTATAGR